MMDPSSEGLLSPSEKKHRRQSYESEGSDLDATEFLDADPLGRTAVASGRETSPSRDGRFFKKPAFLQPGGGSRAWSWRRPFSNCRRCCIFIVVFIVALWLLIGAGGAVVYKKFQEEPPYGQSPPWYPTPQGGSTKSWASSYAKAERLVSRMTLAEKVNVTTGVGWSMGPAVGSNGPASIVGFPQLHLQDGPLGIRFADNASAFPAGVTVAATWNRKLMYERGKAHGAEARGKGINVLLGPCVGPLGRMPAGGRNWEGFGSDPYLQGVAGAETVRGIQSEGVMATIKHFIGNEQEHFRQPWEWGLPHAISSNIDDRALHELYAWPFADAVKAGVASVMCSYNMVNNSYACSNSKLLNGILKDELGFQGFVVSDWLAQRAGVASALSGLDMTMPGDGLKWAEGKSLWGPELTKSVFNGSVPLERLNDMVTRIVASWYQLGQDDPARFDGKGPNFSSWTDDKYGVTSPGSPTPQDKVEVNKFVNVQANHSTIARQVAAEGIVMLKNDNVLPISRLGFTDAKRDLRRRHEGKLKIGIFGEDAAPSPDGPNGCKDRGCNKGTLGSGWGSGAVEFPYLVSPVEVLRKGFDASKVTLSEYLTNTPPFSKDKASADTDVCIVFANADAGEGFLKAEGVSGDRNDLLLQKGGDELVYQVAKHCGGGQGEVVVVVHNVGPVVMERWIDLPTVKAVLLANLPGQESGNALADVIFGDVNPSGKLPYTIGKSLEDYGPGAKVMYIPNGVVPQQDFKEGVFIDYRHFDRAGIKPRFEFGHGLSYTSFEFANISVKEQKPKSPFPAPRPAPGATPPKYSTNVPDGSEALWPADLRRLDKYVYPYLDDVEELITDRYPYPDGYDKPQPPSPAGGDEGGNPDLWDTHVTVSATIRNSGARDGQVVAQLYLSYPATALPGSRVAPAGSPPQVDIMVELPVRVLRGFEKVAVAKGQSVEVEFDVTRRDLSFWDVETQNWKMITDGSYTFSVGQSSRDLPLQAKW
ncbi:hypothetical protein GGTG_12067 [Gaeumannomyces tritici R3-111a-1]|uniref:beta-glucosidase n=1 Tax=Gaeumannomyces tritici (strain R3-111a-1) TaxID=644352 RepID=J3PEY8_GAET3|nr:hypothetical protein GGTG_12067 [Gaeumannomyces tritici R3-111a-1]EJT71046.1 hypothetical protein GGTG_12067 [Gaeumannomyces tritici R3-111a-1]